MSEQLDTYTYAMSKGVEFSTGTTGIEWIGPCPVPGCSSRHDAFSVQPEGKRTGRWAEYGAWMCRRCWDPSEMITVEHGPERGMQRKRGWGTLADLVMACEGMTYAEAYRFILAYEGVIVPLASRPALQKPKTDEVWCAESMEYLALSQRTDAAGRELVANYLASRGLTVETAQRLGLGYSVDTIRLNDGALRNNVPFLVIPWYKNKEEGTLYRTINRRNLHQPLPDDEDKYRVRAGSTKDSLYLGECLLTSKRPTFVVESEFCAAIILQEAGDLVNVVATGSTDGGRNAVNEGRLRRQPFVFLSFDVDEPGKKASEHWQSKLDPEKHIRYKPLMHDVNEMHIHGLSVRQWVESGLAYCVPAQPIVTSTVQSQEPDHSEDVSPAPASTSLQGKEANPFKPWPDLSRQQIIRIAENLQRSEITFSVIDGHLHYDGDFEVTPNVSRFIYNCQGVLVKWFRGPYGEADAFYQTFCAHDGYHLRLLEGDQIAIGVPETLSDEKFQTIQRRVDGFGDVLVQVIKEHPAQSASSRDPRTCCVCAQPAEYFSPSGYPYCPEHNQCAGGHPMQWKQAHQGSWMCACVVDQLPVITLQPHLATIGGRS